MSDDNTFQSETKELTLFEEFRKDLVITDGSEYTVPMAKIFGQGTIAKTESFGGRSLVENSQLVDNALENTRALQSVWNRSHSQWTWKHINLSYHSPHKNMRQISAEISRKKSALNEAKWKQVKNEIKLKKIEEELTSGKPIDYWREVELKVKVAELQEQMAEGVSYIEGAMKDVLSLNELYEQIKQSIGEFDENDIEKEESKAHLKRSVVQCIRDVRQFGSITKGEQEYLEQIGVNPTKMLMTIKAYLQEEMQRSSWDVSGLHTFVDRIVEELIDHLGVDKIKMNIMGFDPDPTPGISYDKKIT